MKKEQEAAVKYLNEAKSRVDAAWEIITGDYEQAAIAIADAGREIDKATAMVMVAEEVVFP